MDKASELFNIIADREEEVFGTMAKAIPKQ